MHASEYIEQGIEVKIMATLSTEEVLQACREYIQRQHGLTAKCESTIRAWMGDTSYLVKQVKC